MNLWEVLTAQRYGHGTLWCWTGDRFESASWSEVVEDARVIAAALRARGVEPGTRVAAVLTNTPAAVRGVLGVWLAGGALASLPVPSRGQDLEEYRRQLVTLNGQLEPAAFVVDAPLVPLAPTTMPGAVPVVAWESLTGGDWFDPSPPEPDDIAFVQYSSGSTGSPKGCSLTARAIGAQLEIILDLFDGDPGRELICSWLPLSHDMGLFGCLLYAWAYDYDLVLSTPDRFMQAPRTWFGDMSEAGCTQTAGTNTALALATRAQRSNLPRGLALRSLVIGAERIEWATLQHALETFGPMGLRAEALRPAYGLAEATLAVTATPTTEGPRVSSVDAGALADGDIRDVAPNAETATNLVSLGPPAPGVAVSLREPGGLSEVIVRSPSLFSGYYADAALTGERLRDGRVATGDLGYLQDGELILVGRSDDLLSVGGRNVYAREIEAAVGALDGVRRGCCTIVDVRDRGTTHLSMLLELREGQSNYVEIARAAARMATENAGISLAECVFLERRQLPKTQTGKVQRFRCRELLTSERLASVARVRLTDAPSRRSARGQRKEAEAGA
jgi:fatty-acyl-CoA synthase